MRVSESYRSRDRVWFGCFFRKVCTAILKLCIFCAVKFNTKMKNRYFEYQIHCLIDPTPQAKCSYYYLITFKPIIHNIETYYERDKIFKQ